MLDSGQLQRYIEEFSITGLTSNPSVFDKSIESGAYDDEIQRKAAQAAQRSISSCVAGSLRTFRSGWRSQG